MDNIQQNIPRANLKKKNIARFVLYSELSKYYTMEEIDQMLATISEGGFVDLKSIIRRLDELERKVAYYHPEGVTINVSPQTVYVGQSAQIEIVVSTTLPANSIKLYRGNVEISHAEESTGFTYTDTVAPSTTDAIVYRIEAQIGGEVKRAEKAVTVEEAVITDYYVGWTTGTKAQFAGKTDSEMINGATGFSSTVNPNYTHAFGSNNIFYLMYQANKAPRKVTLTSGEQGMNQDLVNDNTCPHNDVTIDGVAYKVFGIRMATGYDQADTMIVNF